MAVTEPEADAGSTAEIQVLEFSLNDQLYCVEIEHVAEIVDETGLTTIPNSDSHVLGVMNLRDQTTTIVDPKVVFRLDSWDTDHRIIIFDGDSEIQSGWQVDEVDRVSTFERSTVQSQDDVEAIRADGDAIRGLVTRDDDFLIWVDPTVINDS